MKKYHNIFIFSFVSLFMVACTPYDYGVQGHMESDTQSAPYLCKDYNWSIKNAHKENKNIHAGFQTSQTGDGIYYMFGKVASYYDCAEKISTPLCAQQGCTHKDETCGAYINNALFFGSYNNLLYALVEDEESQLSFMEIDPSTNKRTSLYSISKEPDHDYRIDEIKFAYNNAYFICSESAIENDISMIVKTVLIKVDLENKEYKEIEFEDALNALFIGGTDEYFYTMSATVIKENLLSYEQYYEENTDCVEAYEGDAYRAYFSDYISFEGNKRYEIRKYNINTLEYEAIPAENAIYTNQGCMCYGDVFTYVTLDRSSGKSDVYIYDMRTGQSECIYTDEWIVEYSLADGKVICNLDHSTDEIPSNYEFLYIDIFTKDVVKLANNDNHEYIEFPVWGDTEGYMISPSSAGVGRMVCLSKEDYYSENYSDKEPIN